jgi:hypothetical protein
MRCIIYISVILAAMLVAKFTSLPHACSQANTIALTCPPLAMATYFRWNVGSYLAP